MDSYCLYYNRSPESTDFSFALGCLQWVSSKIKNIRDEIESGNISNEDLIKSFLNLTDKKCYCLKHFPHCTTPIICWGNNVSIWQDAMKVLKRNMKIDYNRRYLTLESALENLPYLQQAIDEHMIEFAKVRGIKPNSIIATEYQSKLKNSLRRMMVLEIQEQKEHHINFCNDDLFACDRCIIFLSKLWKDLLTRLIDERRDIVAWHCDHSENFVSDDSFSKDDKRQQFFKKIKGCITQTERRYRKKGLLTKETQKELRQKKKEIILSEKAVKSEIVF